MESTRYVLKDFCARSMVSTHKIDGMPLSYTSAEKVVILHEDFATHEAAESDAEHAATLAHAEFIAAQSRAKLSTLLVQAHISRGVL